MFPEIYEKNVARKNWKAKFEFGAEQSFNINENTSHLPKSYGIGLGFVRRIWIELGKKEIATKLSLGIEGPFFKIPPTLQFVCKGNDIGQLSYETAKFFGQNQDDEAMLEYLINLTNILFKIFN